MPELKAFRGRVLAGTIIATLMITYAVLLIMAGADSGATIIGYYLIFAGSILELARRHNIACDSRNTPYDQFKFASWAAAIAAAFYSLWVVFNSRVLIGGPIPTLIEQRDALQSSAAAGNNVSEQLVAVQSYIDSPERFAANVWVTLVIFGVLLAVILALVHKVRLTLGLRKNTLKT